MCLFQLYTWMNTFQHYDFQYFIKKEALWRITILSTTHQALIMSPNGYIHPENQGEDKSPIRLSP